MSDVEQIRKEVGMDMEDDNMTDTDNDTLINGRYCYLFREDGNNVKCVSLRFLIKAKLSFDHHLPAVTIWFDTVTAG